MSGKNDDFFEISVTFKGDLDELDTAEIHDAIVDGIQSNIRKNIDMETLDIEVTGTTN